MLDFLKYIKNNKENFFTDKSLVAGQSQASENKEQIVTIPMIAEKQVVSPKSKFDSAGNIPLVKNPQVDENMGLGIEKTVEKKAPVENASKKTGESIDERLTRYFANYNDASPEEKLAMLEQYITKHYASLKDKSRPEQIKIQLADFKKLLSNTKDPASFQMLAEKINVLEKENQVPAAKAATTEQASPELRKRGAMGVAKSIQKCDKENQIELTKIVADTKIEEAIQVGASHVSELNVKNQVAAVNIYKTADISNDAKIQVGKTIVGQYADFAKENQVDIHESMSDNKFWDTKVIEFAASNIYNFNKDNQKAAIQITMNTKNEAAINCAAAKINYYDKSVQTEAKSMLSASGYKSVNETLKTAPAAPISKEKSSETKTSSSTTTAKSAAKVTTATKESFENATSGEKMKMIASMNSSDKATYMKAVIKNASNAEKLALLASSPDMSVINILLDSNPSLEVLSKITSIIGQVQDKDQSALMQKLGNSYSSKVLAAKVSSFDASFQKAFIQKMSDSGTLNLVNEDKLSFETRALYNDLIKK